MNMKKYRNIIFYVITILFFSGLIYWFIIEGKTLEAGENIVIKENKGSMWDNFAESFMVNLHHPLALLLIQIITIIFVARLFGWICMKLKQPSVIGEMIAGIVLGPSLVGLYFPEFSAFLFPKESLGNLQFLSQIGLILFMYIVGMELDLSVLRKKRTMQWLSATPVSLFRLRWELGCLISFIKNLRRTAFSSARLPYLLRLR